MLLSDREIRRRLEDCADVFNIEPFDEADLQPASYDLHLGEQLLRNMGVAGTSFIHPDDIDLIRWAKVDLTDDQVFRLTAKDSIMAHSSIKLTLPDDICAAVVGVSTMGRIGLVVCPGLPFLDPGFSGNVALEISVNGRFPIYLHEDLRVAQLVFHKMDASVEQSYGERGRYQDQTSDVVPKTLGGKS